LQRMGAKNRCNIVLMILLFASMNVMAQNNPYKIDDSLYGYFKTVLLSAPKPQGALMADTLFARAKRVKDLKAQCIALYLKFNHYHAVGDTLRQKVEFKKLSSFVRKTPYKQYYFQAWYYIITSYINSLQYRLASDELEKFRVEAFRYDNSFGITKSYIAEGDILFRQSNFRLALPLYRRALDYAVQHKEKDLFSLYLQIGRCCNFLQRKTEAIEALNKSAEYAWEPPLKSTPVCLLLTLYCKADTLQPQIIDSLYKEAVYIKTHYNLYGNLISTYNISMYYYFLYYKKNAESAKKYVHRLEAEDSLDMYLRNAKIAERGNDYKSAYRQYESLIQWISAKNVKDNNLLLSFFIPKFEYQKVLFERDNLKREQETMKLQRINEKAQLMSLEYNRQHSLTLRRQHEQVLLQNQLALRSQLLLQKEMQIGNKKLMAKQQKENEKIIRDKYKWRFLLTIFVIVSLSLLFVFYSFWQWRVRRNLRLKRIEAENSEKMKSMFFQNMSHEIRNPLNAITGFNELLIGDIGKTLPKEEKNRIIEMISSNSNMLMMLVNDVLDMSNYESGTYSLHPGDVEIKELCHTILESVRGKEKKGVRLVLTTKPQGEYILRTDGNRLQQVLTNYLTNACKYTEEGSITLSYEVLPDVVRFAVTDTGIGIKDEDKETVFERFKMLDKAKNGTGLGLHICRLISNVLHGSVYVDKEYKNGSRFIFDHPIKALMMTLLLLCSFHTSAFAQHNTFHIDDAVFKDYMANFAKRPSDAHTFVIADSIINSAKRKHNVQMLGLMYCHLARIYMRRHDKNNMVKYFKLCYALMPQLKQTGCVYATWSYLMDYYLSLKDYDSVKLELDKYLKEILKYKNDYALSVYYQELGNLYIQKMMYATAIKYYLQSLSYGKTARPTNLMMIGQSYMLLGDYHKAIEYLERSLKAKTELLNTANALTYLGKCYCYIHDKENANRIIRELGKIKDANPDGHYRKLYYGILYYYYTMVNKDKQKALDCLKIAGTAINRFQISELYYETGEYKTAYEISKDNAMYMLKWYQSDPEQFNESYVTNFDFKDLIREKNDLQMNNVRMKVKKAENNRNIIALKLEHTSMLLKETEYQTLQKRNELKLQNIKLQNQQTEYEKQNIINQSTVQMHQLSVQRYKWKVAAMLYLIFVFVIITAVSLYLMHRRKKRLLLESELAKEEERKKNRFFESMNRSMNEPLSEILRLNKLLNSSEGDHLSEKNKDMMIGRLKGSATYLYRIVTNLLDVSKLESGTYVCKLEKQNAYTLCGNVVDEMRNDNNRHISVNFAPDDTISADYVDFNTDHYFMGMVLLEMVNLVGIDEKCRNVTLGYELLPGILRFYARSDSGRTDEMLDMFAKCRDGLPEDEHALGIYKVSLVAQMIGGSFYPDKSYFGGIKLIFDHPRNMAQ
jgi:signal transduction histidine kinase